MIIVVEQDKTRRDKLISILEPCSSVIGVGTARELIWNLKNISLDLILMNPALPDLKGKEFDLVSRVRNNFSKSELPIVLLLPGDDRKGALRGFDAGINDVVHIPLDPELLLARVNHQMVVHDEFKKLLVTYYRKGSEEEFDTTMSDKDPEFRANRLRDRTLPCEIPMTLLAGEKSYFCKSIWITHNSILLLAFEEIPAQESYRLGMTHLNGSRIDMGVIEIRRETIRDTLVPGSLKLNLRIVDAAEDYDELFASLQKAFREDGSRGLRDAMPVPDNDEVTPSLSATMVFSSNDASFNMVEGTRYKFEQNLGRGSFAAVYLVRDNLLKRTVAMKVLNPEYAKLKKARLNFLSEAQISAQFHHPNVVFVYEVGEIFSEHYGDHLTFPDAILADHPERMNYFTMQHVEGETLTNWLGNHGREKMEVYIEIMEKILLALDFAHQKGVTHRDIKPDNILIAKDNQVLVADFGIATLVKTEDGPQGSTDVACTPKYAAPEQLLGEEMDGRSDIYSFGILAYEMLAGKAPFGGRSLAQIAQKHIREKPQPIRKYRKDLDVDLEAVILKCLEMKPKYRHQSAAEILKELSNFRTTDQGTDTVMEVLGDLINQAIVVTTLVDGARILEKMIAFLNLHRTSDNVKRIHNIRSKLSETSLLNLLIEKNLNESNFQLLYQFFMELNSSRAVSNLLQWFCRESNSRTKLFLGELAVISSGRDLLPLVVFGHELSDHEASILLRSFGEVAPKTREPIYLEWAKHGGYQTQMELLKIITVAERPETEVLAILDHYVNGHGTVHQAVRRLADELLDEHLAH